MAHIEKRRGKYRARWLDPLGRVHSRTFNRRAGAERFTMNGGGGWRDRVVRLRDVSVERLFEARNLWLATVRPSGRPHLAPVWFVYVGDRIWICTGTGSVRVRDLRSDPAASACLEDGTAPVVAAA